MAVLGEVEFSPGILGKTAKAAMVLGGAFGGKGAATKAPRHQGEAETRMLKLETKGREETKAQWVARVWVDLFNSGAAGCVCRVFGAPEGVEVKHGRNGMRVRGE